MKLRPTAWMNKLDNHEVTFDRKLVKEAVDAGSDIWIPLYNAKEVEKLEDEIIELEHELKMTGEHWFDYCGGVRR